MKKEAREMVTYIIEHDNGKRSRITVPETWKVTFGPAVKGFNASDAGGHRRVPMALRFYESDTKQRAIFTDVKSFRDMSIKVEQEVVKTQEKEGFMECDGVKKRTIFQAKVKEWADAEVDVNESGASFPLLPADSEMFETNEDE